MDKFWCFIDYFSFLFVNLLLIWYLLCKTRYHERGIIGILHQRPCRQSYVQSIKWNFRKRQELSHTLWSVSQIRCKMFNYYLCVCGLSLWCRETDIEISINKPTRNIWNVDTICRMSKISWVQKLSNSTVFEIARIERPLIFNIKRWERNYVGRIFYAGRKMFIVASIRGKSRRIKAWNRMLRYENIGNRSRMFNFGNLSF